MKKSRAIVIIIIAVVAGAVLFSLFGKNNIQNELRIPDADISHYTCGMHPNVKVSPEEYEKGKVNCPVCNMNLTPVYEKESRRQGRETKGKAVYYGCGVDTEGKCPFCDLGKPDEKCICGEHSFIFKGQKLNCPVCREPLRELTKAEADRLKGVVSRVKIKGEQVKLAGVKTEPVKKLHLFKEIRTAGRVAYDPELAIAQEEFISSLRTLDKMQEGSIPEIKQRALKLLESSKRKLRLLGLSEEQIKELKEKRQVQTSLIFPEKKMWIYGDVYEYELSWIKADQKIKVTASGFPGEEFSGIISSINPVLEPKTRSVRFRAEVDNPDLKLKPEMYVDIVIQSMYAGPGGEHMILAIPKDAVLDTGIRKLVWIDKGNGEYEGREIKVGPEAVSVIDGKKIKFYPVIRGLREGEQVVTKANFLIDSQSQISGVAASAYGGALDSQGKEAPPVHQH
jgi:hypothetical protein